MILRRLILTKQKENILQHLHYLRTKKKFEFIIVQKEKCSFKIKLKTQNIQKFTQEVMHRNEDWIKVIFIDEQKMRWSRIRWGRSLTI